MPPDAGNDQVIAFSGAITAIQPLTVPADIASPVSLSDRHGLRIRLLLL